MTTDLTKPKYKYPTIIEAVFELRFPSDNKWGMSSFIKFAQKAEKEGYPKVIDGTEGFQVNFTSEDKTKPEVRPVSRRIQTWNQEHSELWQASPEMYAANRREPYKGWESFRPHILNGLEIYRKIARPKKALSFSLNYINRIELADGEEPSDFVKFIPPGERYADSFESFVCQTQQAFKSGDQIIVSSARDLEPNRNNRLGNNLAILLNVIYVVSGPSLEKNTFRRLIENAHQNIITAFEKSITDKQRKRMVQL